ncbi:MAG: helix-turn-helix transcriptional regulator [Alicyclobacillaceae bacterium]|nr:helix-turn-helix transcriptional regulator [Alicyclobacillaceae bacterium]
MTEPPWLRLARLRRCRGLTQAQLAKGIVSQSTLCQVERGRILPSERTLCRLAERLSVDAGELLDEWRSWRRRDGLRERLWAAVLGGRVDEVRAGLAAADVLTPFESLVYQAYAAVHAGDHVRAEELLWTAWRWSVPRTTSARGPVYADAYAGAWRKTDRARALVVEAWVRAESCRQLRRATASCYWLGIAEERMRDTVWTSGQATGGGPAWMPAIARDGCGRMEVVQTVGDQGEWGLSTEEEIGYRDAIRQVVRALNRRRKQLLEECREAPEERQRELRQRLAELDHILEVVETLRR